MSDTDNVAKKDILFIAPSKTLALHSKIIRTTLWAVENESTYTVMDATYFVDRYGGISAEAAMQKMKADYEVVCNIGTLSKREETAYREIMNPIVKIAKAHSQPQEGDNARQQ